MDKASPNEGTPPELIRDAILLTTPTPRHEACLISGGLVAWKNEGQWTFTGNALTLDAIQAAGEQRPPGPAVFVVDVPADVTRLATAIAGDEGVHRRHYERRERGRQRHRTSASPNLAGFAQLLRPGSLFAGRSVHANGGQTHFVSLEITGRSTTHHTLSAVLGNDGGWSDARRIETIGSSTPTDFATSRSGPEMLTTSKAPDPCFRTSVMHR